MSEVADELGVDSGEPQVEEQQAAQVESPEPVAEPAAPAAPELPFDPAEMQAELEYARQQNSELYGMLEQFVNQSTPQQQQQSGFDFNSITDEFGNLDAQKFAQYQAARDEALVSRIEQQLQAIQAPIMQQQESQVVAEGNQRLQDILADDVARNGEFVRAAGGSEEEIAACAEANTQAKELVTTIASTMFPDLAQRYGPTPNAAAMAMSRAADQVRTLLRSAGVSAVSQNANQLATLANAHGEPGAGRSGTEAPVVKVTAASSAPIAERYAGTFGG